MLHKKDAKGNVGMGSHIMMDTEGTICYSEDKFIAAAYVRDLIIVESKDAILVCPQTAGAGSKKLVDFLEEKGKTEYL